MRVATDYRAVTFLWADHASNFNWKEPRRFAFRVEFAADLAGSPTWCNHDLNLVFPVQRYEKDGKTDRRDGSRHDARVIRYLFLLNRVDSARLRVAKSKGWVLCLSVQRLSPSFETRHLPHALREPSMKNVGETGTITINQRTVFAPTE